MPIFIFGNVRVEILLTQTISTFADGSCLIASHSDVGVINQRATASELGYPSVEDMNREHDLYHHLLARWLGLPTSSTDRRRALLEP